MLKYLERTFRYGLFAVLFVPLLYARPFIFPFITLKVAVFEALVGLLAALYISQIALGRLPQPRLHAVGFSFLILLGIMVVTSLFGVDVWRSFWSTEERALGLIALVHLFAYFVMLTEYAERLPWERYIMVSLGVASLTGLFAFVHIAYPPLFFDLPHADFRPGSFLGNPTFLAAYLLPHFFLALYLAVKKGREQAFGTLTALAAAAVLILTVLFLTQTRGALLGLVAGVIVMGAYFIVRGSSVTVRGISLRALSGALLGGLIVCTVLFWFTREAAVWQNIPGVKRITSISLSSPDLQPRLIALRIAWEAFTARPLLGYGLENYKYTFDARYEPTLLRSGIGETFFDKPHNVFAEYAVAGGIFGFLAYLALLSAIGWILVHARGQNDFTPFGLAILMSYAVQNAFVFDTFGGLMMFGVFAAITESSARNAAPTGGTRMRYAKPLMWGTFVIAIVWVAVQGSTVFVNNRHYAMLNNFLNNMPDKAIASYRMGLHAPFSPYGDAMRRDFASALAQMYVQGSKIPEIKQVAAEAVTTLTGVIERSPKDYYVRLVYGDVASSFSGFDKTYLSQAEQQLHIALELSPRRQQALFALAKLQLLKGIPDEALKTMQAAVELDPQVGDSHFYYGLLLFQAGKPAEGLSEIETAERMGKTPKNAVEARLIAGQYADANEYQKAIEFYNKALVMDPKDLEARLKLGIVYYFMGDDDAARRYIREVQTAIDLRKDSTYTVFKPIYDQLHVFE